MPTRGVYQIPFDAESGDQLLFPGVVRYRPVETEWRDNFEFGATLRVEGVERGRSAAHFHVRVVDCKWGNLSPGTRGWMFLKEFMDVIEREGIRPGGKVSAAWTFVKRGQNYGIRML